jgi:predicted dienelactone hydrolase
VRARTLLVALAALALTTTAVPAASGAPSLASSAPSTATGSYNVGLLHLTLVDHSRSTPRNGSAPRRPSRTLDTFVYYPATTAAGTPPDRGGAPYPLVVFAHGFGETPDLAGFTSILSRWASAGFVVAAPLFPLTRGDAPGNPDLADYVHQPGDMSFVITQLLAQSAQPGNVLHGMIDPGEIGAAGHSLGGVTTLGVVTNSCCRDRRVRAAIVMSGDQITFPSGRTVWASAPPLLFVHGSADPVVPYAASLYAFNRAHAPKGLLTILGGDHSSPVDDSTAAFPSIVSVTTAFLDRYVAHRRPSTPLTDITSGPTRFVFAGRPGQHLSVPIPKVSSAQRVASVTPSRHLHDGQAVTVHWRGYQPGVSVNILECSVTPPTSATDCNLRSATLLHADPTGSGSAGFVVHTGRNGTKRCDATHDHCVVVVNQGGSTAPSASTLVPISFSPSRRGGG